MLSPDDRQLLVDALRPPSGYRLDRAIGTTYSLDLLTLLAIPLNFTLLDWRSENDGRLPNPLAILEALRRFASKMVIFCQAGQIYVPKQHQLLYSSLEQSVIEVAALKPRHVFHPKVWALRFEPRHVSGEDEAPVRYRLIVSSRNITFDKSWDTILILDGFVTGRRNAISRNHPLGNFIANLPDLAVGPVPNHVRDLVHQMQFELRRVAFELPEEVEEIRFWPAGLTNRRTWPFGGRIDRLMVISPFLSNEFLERLPASDRDVLVSRLNELAELNIETQGRFAERYVLSEHANVVDENVATDADRRITEENPDRGAGESLNDLHAKVFVADAGWNARVWTGSANATSAAFSGNVEFVVELRGRKSRLGIDAVLGGDAESALQSLLEPVQILQPRPEDDTRQLEALVDDARRAISRASLRVEVRPSDGSCSYQMALLRTDGERLQLPDGVAISSRPITWGPDDQRPVDFAHAEAVSFEPVSLEAITPFVVFRIDVAGSDHAFHSEFVRNLPLIGSPEERESRILRSLFQNPSDVMRYLLMLLAEGELESGDAYQMASALAGSEAAKSDRLRGIPLFESLVRALYHNPEKLDEIAQLVDDLREASGAEDLLPRGFDRIWEPIWRMRCEVSS